MKEYQLKCKARDYFKEKGFQVWMPPRVKWVAEQDIFSIWDGVCWKKNMLIGS